MQKGFNHNIRYRDRIFHVQTEDSGERNPLVVTHLFDGGDILASRRIEYRMILQKPDFERQVRRMMAEQHKALVRDLVRGAMDGLIDAHDRVLPRRAPKAPPVSPAPGSEPDAVTMKPAKRSTLEEYMESGQTLDELVLRSLLEMERVPGSPPLPQ